MISLAALRGGPPPFTYTLKYRRDGPNSYSLIAPKNRWTFSWDGNAGTVDRGAVHPLNYLSTQPGTADDGTSVEFYFFVETDPLETRVRKWALEAVPKRYISGVADLVCTVGWYYDRDPDTWEEMGLATKKKK
jgi:hypothetical protein